MNKKGFTLLETLVSVTIFSVLMAIVFGAWTEFQKVSLKNEGKQDTNVTFVNVYRNIDKIVSSSSVRLFRSYLDDRSDYLNFKHKNLRWFAFLLSRHNQQLDGRPLYKVPKKTTGEDATTSDVLVYNTCVVYLLYTPNDSCGGFQNCPHKSLYRYVFSVPNIYFASGSNSGTNFKNILNNDVRAVLINRNARPFSVIANNIVDLKIRKNDDKIRFFLRLLRINDAERHFQIGTKQLTDINPATEYDIPEDNEAKNFVEDLSWISVPSNT